MSVEATIRERLSVAFRRAYEEAGMSQEALADAIRIKQTTISKYSRGAVQPPLDVLERVEEACGYRRGHILRLAGFVDDSVDAATAIRTDPTLTPEEQHALLMVYDQFRAQPEPAPAGTTTKPLPPLPDDSRDVEPDLSDPDEADFWSRTSLPEDVRRKKIWDLRRADPRRADPARLGTEPRQNAVGD